MCMSVDTMSLVSMSTEKMAKLPEVEYSGLLKAFELKCAGCSNIIPTNECTKKFLNMEFIPSIVK